MPEELRWIIDLIIAIIGLVFTVLAFFCGRKYQKYTDNKKQYKIDGNDNILGENEFNDKSIHVSATGQNSQAAGGDIYNGGQANKRTRR